MGKRQCFFLSVITITGLILSACSAAPTVVSTETTEPVVETGTAITVDQTAQPCGYMWASEHLPEVNSRLLEAITSAGLKGVTGWAEAYGENCVDAQTNAVVSFSAMETDFHLKIETADLKDLMTLGNQAEQVLTVLDQFPPEKTPGPQPGYIGIQFTSGQDSLNLWFLYTVGVSARQQDLHGADLINYLQNK